MQGKGTQQPARRLPPGIAVRHSRKCAIELARREARDSGELGPGETFDSAGVRCTCKPTYRAWVFDRRTGEKVYPRKPLRTLAEAKQWRADATSAQGKGRNITPSRDTLREAAEAWLAGAKASPPTVLNRSGRPYKPSALRGYEADLRRYVLDGLGGQKLSDIRRGDVQALVDRLVGKGIASSTVRNIVVALRVVYRHAIERDELEQNPTSGVRLPNGVGRRDRAATPAEAAELLTALPVDVRPVYATAFYAGLRRGELRGLRWSDVDLANGVIRVERAWDDLEGAIEPKSQKGTRTIPLVALLRDELVDLKARTGRDGSDFVFGAVRDRPFTPNNVRRGALRAWKAENTRRTKAAEERAEKPKLLEPIGLHECRHTYVSLMFDAGLSLERIGDYVGHSSTYMTDRYRHLLEGHEQEVAKLLDEYLARADSTARIDQVASLSPDA